MKKNRTQKSKSVSPLQHFNVFGTLFFVLAFALLNIYSGYTSMAAKPPSSSPLIAPNLSLLPASQQVSRGSTLSVQIWTDTGNQLVNAVQANLSYPIDKLNFVNIDTANSAFGVAAQGTGGNGVVNIARGSTSPVSGKALVATVNFTPLTVKGKAKAIVSFTTGTALVSATTNDDILAATYGGNYSL